MLSEVRVYRPNKETKKLELNHVVSKERVSFLWNEELNKSRSHKSTKMDVFKAKNPSAKKRTCHNCGAKYYSVNKRNTKFCSQKCGRIMSNEYKKERGRLEREKRNANSTIQ